MPVIFQKKLLFYIENEKLFSANNIKINIKIIALTSKNLEKEIEYGNFIKNLFYRLKVVELRIPPIKERREDVVPICNFYLEYFNINKKFNFNLSKNSSDKLEIYDWPGNVRQIVNYIEKTIILNLNEGFKGGETAFKFWELEVSAKAGQLIQFNNMLDTKVDKSSVHSGKPVIDGEKWICTLWFREKPFWLRASIWNS